MFEKQDIGFEIRPDEDGINYIDEGFNPNRQGNTAVKWPIQGRLEKAHDTIDAIINSQTRSNNNFEDLFNVALGGKFGPKNNWKAEVSGGKGRAGFNIAKLF